MRLTAMNSHMTSSVAAQSDALSKAHCSCAKKSRIDAFDRDEALPSDPTATKKLRCDTNDHGTDIAAMEPLKGLNKPMRPTGAPPGLFDFHTEAEGIRNNFPIDSKKRLQLLKERAKATKYFYGDKETLMVAVDLYNCSNKVYVNGNNLFPCVRHEGPIWSTHCRPARLALRRPFRADTANVIATAIRSSSGIQLVSSNAKTSWATTHYLATNAAR
jgi:hypothetical protein